MCPQVNQGKDGEIMSWFRKLYCMLHRSTLWIMDSAAFSKKIMDSAMHIDHCILMEQQAFLPACY
jgi:chromosome condensin MukBEF complex kleisin-like MukF subunit